MLCIAIDNTWCYNPLKRYILIFSEYKSSLFILDVEFCVQDKYKDVLEKQDFFFLFSILQHFLTKCEV